MSRRRQQRSREREQMGVAIFVFRRSPGLQVLLLRRAGGGMVGEWCPIAGRGEPGEQPAETARREAEEETGLDLASLSEPDTAWVGRVGPRHEPIRIFVFSAQIATDSEVRLNYEHTAKQWCAPDRALSLLPLKQQRRALKLVLERSRAVGSETR